VYADSTCGLNTAFAVLAALDERERTGHGEHIDISLYETAVSHLGPVLAEQQLGAAPARFGNADVNYLIHGVFACAGTDRHIAVAATEGQREALLAALNISEATSEAVAKALASRDAADTAAALQQQGIAASAVNDASDCLNDEQLWERGYFGLIERNYEGTGRSFPHVGPAWGHGPAVPLQEPHAIGADSAAILEDVGGYSSQEVEELVSSGVTGTMAEVTGSSAPRNISTRIKRGELSRVEPVPAWPQQLAPRGARS
jgi:benzylsuccinate CoA-transferase BbsF subunit